MAEPRRGEEDVYTEGQPLVWGLRAQTGKLPHGGKGDGRDRRQAIFQGIDQTNIIRIIGARFLWKGRKLE